MVKKTLLTPVLVACFVLGACGSSGSTGNGEGNPPPAGIAGKWEIISTSTQNPAGSYPHTAIETNLTQAGTSVFAGDQATYVIPFGAQGIDEPVGPLNPCGGLPVIFQHVVPFLERVLEMPADWKQVVSLPKAKTCRNRVFPS